MAKKSSLIIRMKVVQGKTQGVPLDCLIDTGCEIYLIRNGLVGKEFFEPSDKIIRLVTANGSILPGGDRQVTLALQAHANLMEEGGIG